MKKNSSQQSSSKILIRSTLEPPKVTSPHSNVNGNSALDKFSAPHTKANYFTQLPHNFQAMLIEKTNSWNNLNESASPSSEEDNSTDFSDGTKEHPIYLFPPNTEYPEDDQHDFYYRNDFPNHSHLQIVCSYFRLGPIYRLVISSLEYFEHQKNYPAQRPLTNCTTELAECTEISRIGTRVQKRCKVERKDRAANLCNDFDHFCRHPPPPPWHNPSHM